MMYFCTHDHSCKRTCLPKRSLFTSAHELCRKFAVIRLDLEKGRLEFPDMADSIRRTLIELNAADSLIKHQGIDPPSEDWKRLRTMVADTLHEISSRNCRCCTVATTEICVVRPAAVVGEAERTRMMVEARRVERTGSSCWDLEPLPSLATDKKDEPLFVPHPLSRSSSATRRHAEAVSSSEAARKAEEARIESNRDYNRRNPPPADTSKWYSPFEAGGEKWIAPW